MCGTLAACGDVCMRERADAAQRGRAGQGPRTIVPKGTAREAWYMMAMKLWRKPTEAMVTGRRHAVRSTCLIHCSPAAWEQRTETIQGCAVCSAHLSMRQARVASTHNNVNYTKHNRSVLLQDVDLPPLRE